MSATYKGLAIRKVTVTGTFEFEAYVLDETEDLKRAIAWEIADAIEFRAPRLTDTEEGDGLVALVNGGLGEQVEITNLELAVSVGDATTSEAVEEAVEQTDGWLS